MDCNATFLLSIASFFDSRTFHVHYYGTYSSSFLLPIRPHPNTALCTEFHIPTPPSALLHTGRIVNPKVLPPAITNRYQTAFDQFFLTTADTLEDECQIFSTAVLQAVENVFGPPSNLKYMPAVVKRAQVNIQQFVMQHPQWWKDTTHIHTYPNKKGRIGEAWDLVRLERKLHTANETNAPRNPLCRTHFRTGPHTRIEPMFVSGISTPTEVHGLVGMDHFRQRHLAPPLRMEAEHIQYYMNWSPLTIPHLQFTA